MGLDTQKKTPSDLTEWDNKWLRVQSAADSIPIGDHWRICELKFRFRNYRELFHCLDLMETRVAKLSDSASERRYAPVLVDWMRSEAQAELGQLDEATRSAERAWSALPSGYREVGSVAFECFSTRGLNPLCKFQRDEFASFIIEAGGSQWRTDANASVPNRLMGFDKIVTSAYVGETNPAGLDLRPQTVTMRLAALRSVLHAQRGEPVLAQSALADLDKWNFRFGSGKTFTGTACSLALGPWFAQGDYLAVINAYETIAGWRRGGDRFARLSPLAWIELSALSHHDTRQFAAALEDASNAFLYASSLARVGATDRAVKAFDELLAAPDVRGMGSLYWAALYERSGLALTKGAHADEIAFLQQAVDAIEQVRSSINFEAGKIGFASSKQAVYAALVRALADSGDWRGAFQAAERAKARALVDLLAQVHELAPPEEAGEKVRQLLASATVNEAQIGLPVDEDTVHTRNLIETARAELPQLAPEAASLISVQTASLQDIAAKLAPDETLINYFHAGEDLYAFVLHGTEVKGFKLEGKGLEAAIRGFRTAIETGNPAAAEGGHMLYERLIRPLASEIPGPKLTLSPSGVLHYLPFAALQEGDQYLIDRYSLRVIGSASALAYLKSAPPTKPGKLLAFGNPDLGDPRYDLPNAQQEALQVAQLFPASRALVRQQASKAALKELGSGFAMLHFASHAKFDPDSPLNSGLYLAKGTEADGRLTVSDLYAMRLDVQLVTLSACETGLGQVLSGDDVIGLTRGFLYAGARSIVASLWSVDDAATAELMIRFYQNLSSHGSREALRLAQIDTRQKHPSPRLWAAFEITGNGD